MNCDCPTPSDLPEFLLTRLVNGKAQFWTSANAPTAKEAVRKSLDGKTVWGGVPLGKEETFLVGLSAKPGVYGTAISILDAEIVTVRITQVTTTKVEVI